jgi:hypothetical protein
VISVVYGLREARRAKA